MNQIDFRRTCIFQRAKYSYEKPCCVCGLGVRREYRNACPVAMMAHGVFVSRHCVVAERKENLLISVINLQQKNRLPKLKEQNYVDDELAHGICENMEAKA